MSKDDKPTKLEPRLRFPRFRNAAGWNVKRLGGQGDFLSSLTGKSGADFGTGDAVFIPYMNVFSNTFTDLHDLRAVNVGDGETQNTVARGDVFFTVSSETPEDAGMSSVLLGDIENCYLNSFCALFRFHEGRSPDPVFLGYALRSGVVRKHLARGAQGATRYNISKGVFRDVPLLLPEPAEQRKVAECLGSLDDLIAAETDALATLRRHKTGLMQQLFPRPGETRPRLRFPEFRDAGEWEKRKAGTLFKQRKEKGTPGLPIYSVTIDSGLVKRSSFDRNFYDIEDAAGNKKVRRGDIAYNMMRMWQGACGFAQEDCLVSPAYVVLKPGSDAHAPFFQYFFKLHSTLQILTAYSRGLTLDRLRLYFEDFVAMPLVVPSPAEQHRIADCLLSLDSLIASQGSKLAELRRHKRGLMQQLFPVPNLQPGEAP